MTNHHRLGKWRNWGGCPLAVLFVASITACSFSKHVLAAEEGETEAAEDESTVIIVTAQRIEEKKRDVPGPVAILYAATLEETSTDSFDKVADLVPNLWVVNWGLRQDTYFYIRGVGTSRSTDGAIGIYIDDVPYLHYGSFDILLNDIERMEVLLGPQGTLYGRNTLGGVLNVVSKSVFDAEDRASVAFGNNNMQRFSLIHRAPLIDDTLGLGISISSFSRDGFTQNLARGGDTIDDRQALSGRLRLQWIIGSRLELSAAANGEVNRDGALPETDFNQMRADPFKASHDFQGSQNRDIGGGSVAIKYWADEWMLTSVTAIRSFDETIKTDLDFSPAAVVIGRLEDDNIQMSQEVRFNSVDAEDAEKRLSWQGGIFVFHNETARNAYEIWDVNTPGPPFTPLPGEITFALADMESNGAAIFGQAAYKITEKLKLTGGLRWHFEQRDADVDVRFFDSATSSFITDFRSDSLDYDALAPKVAATYQLAKKWMTYSSVSRGFKAGGFNPQADQTAPEDFTYEPEFTWNFELGTRASFFGGKAEIDASTFWIIWKDQQIVQQVGAARTVVRNAEESRILGFELQGKLKPAPGLTLVAGIGVTDAEYTKGILDGNTVAVAPEYMVNASIRYQREFTKDLTWMGRVEFQGVGDLMWDDINTIPEDRYGLLNIRSAITFHNLTFNIWVENVFDEEYAAIAFRLPTGQVVGEPGEPFKVGIGLEVRF